MRVGPALKRVGSPGIPWTQGSAKGEWGCQATSIFLRARQQRRGDMQVYVGVDRPMRVTVRAVHAPQVVQWCINEPRQKQTLGCLDLSGRSSREK